MNLRTFTAESMPAALALVKQSLGADAVILHTRNYKRGGLFGFGAKMVVEITASPGEQTPSRRRRRGGGNRSGDANSAAAGPARRRGVGRASELGASRLQQPLRRTKGASVSGAPLGRGASVGGELDFVEGASQQSAGDLMRRTYLAAQVAQSQEQANRERLTGQIRGDERPAIVSEAKSAQRVADASSRGGDVIARISDVNPTSSTAGTIESNRESARAADDLAEELQAVKRMVAKMVRQQREGKPGAARKKSAQCDLPDKLFDQYLGLLQQEVTEELAEEIIQQVRASVDPSQLDDAEVVRKAVQQAITQLIPAGDNGISSKKPEDGRPRTIALIGPTGVGKTTTIAKLAANFKLRDKKKVGLITIDTFRIAAVDQLKTYASIIGVPLQVISRPEQMAGALEEFSQCDVVLIDTAGRSQRDDPKLDQLNSFIQAAAPHEVHLVLSSTCTQSAIIDVVERFDAIRVDQIIFTKLDEAVTLGVLLNVSRKVKKRLSYITTGQEVPHQIETGSSDRVAALVLGEAV